MSRHVITLNTRADRERADKYVRQAPVGTRVEFKASKRTLPQNDRLWAMLTDVAQQKSHCGRKYTPEQWKVLFMHAWGKEVQFLPALDEQSVVPWGYSSSDLSKEEMGELMEFISAWGAENEVEFHEPANAA